MTTIKLFRKASGTNSLFHLDGVEVAAKIVYRAGIGDVYIVETSNASDARRLQIVHGFRVEARGTINVDRAQVAAISGSLDKKEESPKPVSSTPQTKASKKSTKKDAGK